MDLAFSCLVWSCEASGKAQTSIETPPEICCFADVGVSYEAKGVSGYKKYAPYYFLIYISDVELIWGCVTVTFLFLHPYHLIF